MEAERWQRINDLFLSALEREPAGRVAFINEACAGDDKLRREVESLLAAHEDAPEFIEEPLSERPLVCWPVNRAVPNLVMADLSARFPAP